MRIAFTERLAVTALATTVALALPPAASQAGTYDVVACAAAPGGANHSWSAYVPGPRMHAQPNCSGGAGLVVSNRPGAGVPAPGEQAWLSFWAPPGANVVSATFTGGYWRPGGSEPGAEDYSAQLVDADRGSHIDGCSGYSTAHCASWSAAPRTVSFTPTRGIALVASCWGGRCRDGLTAPSPEFGAASAAVRMTALSVRVSDTSLPTVISAVPGGWLRGTRTIAYSASDNVGIRTMRLQVGGADRASETLTCDYTRSEPCPPDVDRAYELDTTSLPDGPHAVRAEAVDAAANAGASPAATVRVDNTPPSVSLSGAGSSSSPHPGPVTVALDARDAASGMGGGEIVWKLDDSGWQYSAGDEAEVRVEGDGEHRLAWYAVDAAGNRSSEGTRTIAIQRPREPSPRDPGPGFAARTANPGTTFTAARRFGDPCPAEATFAADRTAALNGRTLLLGFPLPGAPDCAVVSATLRIHVAAHDGKPIEATRASSAWSPAAVTWDTRPGLVGAASATPARLGWVEQDVTAQVAGLYRHGDNGLYVTGAATDRPAQLTVRFSE